MGRSIASVSSSVMEILLDTIVQWIHPLDSDYNYSHGKKP
jgi:hypothetical protein